MKSTPGRILIKTLESGFKATADMLTMIGIMRVVWGSFIVLDNLRTSVGIPWVLYDHPRILTLLRPDGVEARIGEKVVDLTMVWTRVALYNAQQMATCIGRYLSGLVE
jgi:hypothetical protein